MKLEELIRAALTTKIADSDIVARATAAIMESELPAILNTVASDFEIEGCEDCGTMSFETMNMVRELIGWDPLEGD